MVRTIALTGGIGSGKSALADELRSLGYAVLDADLMSREVLFEPDVAESITAIFGSDAFVSPGQLNREKLRSLVFAQPELRARLESIIHPAVRLRFNEARRALNSLSPMSWLFYEIPLLFETGSAHEFDAVVVVEAPLEIRRSRVMASRGIGSDAFDAVLRAQVSDAVRRADAHLIVDNSGPRESLPERTFWLVQELRARFSRSDS